MHWQTKQCQLTKKTVYSSYSVANYLNQTKVPNSKFSYTGLLHEWTDFLSAVHFLLLKMGIQLLYKSILLSSIYHRRLTRLADYSSVKSYKIMFY